MLSSSVLLNNNHSTNLGIYDMKYVSGNAIQKLNFLFSKKCKLIISNLDITLTKNNCVLFRRNYKSIKSWSISCKTKPSIVFTYYEKVNKKMCKKKLEVRAKDKETIICISNQIQDFIVDLCVQKGLIGSFTEGNEFLQKYTHETEI
jgi:hypothetical protein